MKITVLKQLTMGMIALGILSMSIISCGSTYRNGSEESEPPSHEKWDALLKRYVDNQGMVDYKAFAEAKDELNKYLELLSSSPPNTETWSEKEQIAYWINAYNAFTVQLILKHYPVESIKDIKRGIPFVNTVWDIKFIEIGGEEYDLNNLEHGILRKDFNEPRVHYALVCAAISCPRLRTEAYTAEKLDTQLDEEGAYFINESGKNKVVSPNNANLSSIFKWYGGDFDDVGGVVGAVNKYSDIKLNEDAEISYKDYDWSLNEQ